MRTHSTLFCSRSIPSQAFNSQRNGEHVLAMDMGGSSIKYVVADSDKHFDFVPNTEDRTPTPFRNPKGVVDITTDVIAKEYAQHKVRNVSIGMAGIIDHAGEINQGVAQTSGNMEMPANYPIAAEIIKQLNAKYNINDVQIVINNDAIAAARGAMVNHPEIKEAIFGVIGTGVGGTIITTPRGQDSPVIIPSEFGQRLVDDVSPAGLPEKVTLEQITSTMSLTRRLKQHMGNPKNTEWGSGKPTARQFGTIPYADITTDNRKLAKILLNSSRWFDDPQRKELYQSKYDLKLNDAQRTVLDGMIDDWHTDIAKTAAQLKTTHPQAEKFFLFGGGAKMLDIDRLQKRTAEYTGVVKVPDNFFVYIPDEAALKGAAAMAPLASKSATVAKDISRESPFAWGTAVVSLIGGTALGAVATQIMSKHKRSKEVASSDKAMPNSEKVQTLKTTKPLDEIA